MFSLLLLSLTVLFSPHISSQENNPLRITTSTGTYLGLINGTAPSVRQFLNIPYGLSTAGERRFAAPVPVDTTSGDIIDSTQFPLSCAQYLGNGSSVYNQDVPEFIIDSCDGGCAPGESGEHALGAMAGSSGEECLSLAVWTPMDASEGAALPVIMFVTGGGFNNGGINIQYQLPHHWVQRTQSHIVVTINYRLAILGFPSARALQDSSQNLGILDQRLALEWVRDNIAAFGGDPDRITLWGQSAGAGSVDVHNFAFPDDVIAKGLFMMSGTSLLLSTSGTPDYSNFSFVAEHLGCGDQNAGAELECMRGLDVRRIVNFVGNYNDGNNGSLPALRFGPVADGEVVFANYTERTQQGLYSKVPAIVSNCANEGAGLTTYPVNNVSAGPWQVAADMSTLNGFICPSHTTSMLRSETGSRTYRYWYAGNFSNVSPRSWMGSYHDSDLPMVMGTWNDFRPIEGADQTFQRSVSEEMQNLVLAFMKDPDQGVRNMGWGGFRSGEILQFGGTGGRVVGNVSVDTVDGACYGAGDYDSSP